MTMRSFALVLACATLAVGATGVDDDATRARRLAALMGGFVADSAAMPLHWIYDTDLIASILAESNRTANPEFLPTNKYCLYYDYPVGEFTPFGEQTAVYLGALAAAQRVDPQAIADAYADYYAAPQQHPWVSYVDNATRGFLENVAAGRRFPHTGAGDTETNAVAHVIAVAAMRAGRPGFLADAEAAIRVVQDNDDAVAFGMTYARILERVILGSPVEDAILGVAELLRTNGTGNPNDRWFGYALGKMDEWRARPPVDVTLEIGQACDFPFHILTAPQYLLHHAAGAAAATADPTAAYVQAVRDTIKIGGENANRGSFIGSLLAAAAASPDAPLVALPLAWTASTTRFQQMLSLAEAIVDGGSNGNVSRARPVRPPKAQERVRRVAAATASAPSLRGPGLGNAPGCIAHGNSTTSNATRPPSHPDDVAGLRALYLSTGGPDSWLRNGCWLNESVPVCWWDQVLCNTTTWRVRELRLSSNVLVGTLPSEIGLLSHLERLQVTFNQQLTGTLPDSIGSLTSLQWLYAWNASLGSVPSSIGALSNSLTRVDMMDNRIAGALPSSLAQLTRVTTAYFDDNTDLQCPLTLEVASWLKSVEYSADPCAAP